MVNFRIAGFMLLLLDSIFALPYDHLNDQVEAAIDSGTFQDPSVNVRPRFRFWLPDASINATLFADDILQLREIGAGGIEFLSYYNYGGSEGPAATDWSIYGYGTPAYRQVLKAALQTHKDNGLIMDFAMGPQSGQGVPAQPDEPGLSWELVSYNTSIEPSYTGKLPGWGMGHLVSAVTFAVLNTSTVDVPTFTLGTSFDSSANYSQLLISFDSLTDVTDSIGSDGSIMISGIASADDAQDYLLYASYARRSYARACIPSSANPQNILQNGSFAVDHYSTTGAQLTIDFLEQYVLTDGIKELMMQVGNYIWEDSVEIPTLVYWTPDLDLVFQQQHGYSIRKYVPLLAGDSGDVATMTYATQIRSDAPEIDAGIVADWRTTMTYLYSNYLAHLTNWTNTYLDLQFSAQVAYNLPLDMLRDIPYVNAPETETLSFTNNIDSFRQYSGPADLAGKRVISIELGATVLETYTQTLLELLMNAKHAFVGGVNQVVIHGATYSHAYANTTWPGFTSFVYVFAGQHSRHQPAWEVGYPEAVNYLARAQFVLQSGVPKVDLVIWDKQTSQNPYPNTTYVPLDLTTAGYSYEYLSPDNFALDSAMVGDGVLAPTRQAFKALILRGNDTLTTTGVSKLAQYAEAGLTIIIAGGTPTRYDTSDTAAISSANAELQSIISLANVHETPSYEVGSTLDSIGVAPRTKVCSNATWWTRWREDMNGTIYVFVYNDGDASNGTIAFQSTLPAYILDAWTGEVQPVVEYSIVDGYTLMSFTLLPTQATIVMFSSAAGAVPGTHVVSGSDFIIGYDYTSCNDSITAKVTSGPSDASLVLSTGECVFLEVASSVDSLFKLTNWTLTVEMWLPPAELYDIEILANITTATFDLPGPVLPSWSEIAGLANVSGVGHYSTSFDWSPSSANAGACLVIPPMAQGLACKINGKELPTFDITNPNRDITPYLIPGRNQVAITAATTLFNSLRPVWDKLLTGGTGPAASLDLLIEAGYGEQLEGIIGEVTVIPYEAVVVI